MTHFYIEQKYIQDEKIFIEGDAYRHVVTVRRHRAGDTILVIDGTGKEYTCRIEHHNNRRCTAEILEVRERRCEPSIFLTLYQALIKIPRFEMILEKSVELGVSRVIPILSERTLVNSRNLGKERLRRWEKILISAACQSGRTRIPELGPLTGLEEALRHHKEECLFLFSPHAPASSLRQAAGHFSSFSAAGLLVGPEGGFTSEEIEMAHSMGAKEVYLGPRILRAETAAIASVALVLYELEERMRDESPGA